MILHVTAPGMAGGLETVVLELTSGLSPLGVRVVLVTVLEQGAEDHPVPARATDLGVEVRRLILPARAYLREYRQLRAVIDELCPDVVHTHGYRADLVAGLAAGRAGVPWVSTVHGFTGGGRRNRFYASLQVRSYRWAHGVVVVSRPIKDLLMSAGLAADKIYLIPNAWAPKPLLPRADARSRLGLVGENPVIGWVGRLTHEKGGDVFLDALARLPHRSWYASVIGDGRERAALEAQAQRLGISDRIRWHGMMPDASALYAAFDVWVLSSRTEGTPIALFEAMAARVPVVATSVGGVPDVVSSLEAVLVPSERPEALAAAMNAVLADLGAAASRADAARRRLGESFPRSAWLDAHLALYLAVSQPDEGTSDA